MGLYPGSLSFSPGISDNVTNMNKRTFSLISYPIKPSYLVIFKIRLNSNTLGSHAWLINFPVAHMPKQQGHRSVERSLKRRENMLWLITKHTKRSKFLAVLSRKVFRLLPSPWFSIKCANVDELGKKLISAKASLSFSKKVPFIPVTEQLLAEAKENY